MAPTSSQVGTPIVATIGWKGQRPDLYAAKIVGPTALVMNNGQPIEVARIIMVQKNLAGEEYLAERLHNLQFAFDRSERVELLDGTAKQPKSWQQLVQDRQTATLAYFATRPESDNAVALDSLPE
jgi:hypothetical protein